MSIAATVPPNTVAPVIPTRLGVGLTMGLTLWGWVTVAIEGVWAYQVANADPWTAVYLAFFGTIAAIATALATILPSRYRYLGQADGWRVREADRRIAALEAELKEGEEEREQIKRERDRWRIKAAELEYLAAESDAARRRALGITPLPPSPAPRPDAGPHETASDGPDPRPESQV